MSPEVADGRQRQFLAGSSPMRTAKSADLQIGRGILERGHGGAGTASREIAHPEMPIRSAMDAASTMPLTARVSSVCMQTMASACCCVRAMYSATKVSGHPSL